MKAFVLGDHVRIAIFDAHSILLDPLRGVYYSLSSVATVLCSALGAPCSEEALERVVLHHFEVIPEVARQDIRRFLDCVVGLRLCTVLDV